MDHFLRALCEIAAVGDAIHMTLEEIGRSQKGLPILMVTAAVGSVPDPPVATLIAIAAQHGDEPAGTRAVLELLRDLVALDDDADRILPEGVVLYAIPVANPDGAQAFRRMTACGRNLNRDWNTRLLPETQAIAKAIAQFKPEVLLDLHEQTPLCPGSAYVAGDPGKQVAGLLNAVAEAFRSHGVRVPVRRPSNSGSNRLLHHNFAATLGRPALLVESSYTRKAEADLPGRSAIHKTTIRAVADALAQRRGVTVGAR